MSSVRTKYPSKFLPGERLQKVIAYNQELAISGRRNLYTADENQLVYHWTDKANGCIPQSGEWAATKESSFSLGDHACRVDIGEGFPRYKEVPSHVEGYEATPLSWGKDYAFLLDNSPAEIHPFESIVGEFHWEMNEIRQYYFGDKVHELGREVRKLGAGGTSHGHTCLDFSIGLTEGWGGILERIDKSLALYTRLDHPGKVNYLQGLRYVCQAIIDYIQKYADKAYELAQATDDPAQKALYKMVADDCAHISRKPPETYHQGVQWIQFGVMTDRIVGHGNGYGRIDLYLNDLLVKDLESGRITRQEAREYLAELFLKIRGQHFTICGRLADGSDATNDMSWVTLEAYDMVDDYNNLFLMWHKDMDQKLLLYACDVLARHGASVPTFCNYDLLVDCEMRSGVPWEDAWTVAVGGCQWFCVPGKEYCDQDVNSLVLLDPMWRAIDRGIENPPKDFEELFASFTEEFKRTAEALRVFKDAQYEVIDKVWPEMATSLSFHGPVERGIDITGHRGVDYQYTSANVLGIPNVADSLYAIKKLVFDEKAYTLADVRKATSENWEDNEIMRQRFLRQDKFGNDLDEVDELLVRITDMIADVLDNTYNNRGQQYRASLYQFQGHTATNVLPATPDGRLANEPLAHGINPTAGRNTKGLLATANSLAKVHNYKFLGGTLQIELQPKFFDGKENLSEYIKNFIEAYFSKNTFQVNLNIIDLEKLKDAIDHPENPEYQNIVIKVTGYTTRFICLAKPFQVEFCGRNNYGEM
ncbi:MULTISPECIES: pyruvate formate lyase family protein [Anaerotruncus]|uniref:pyruvate formate lyase family protein n=2 Tax=Oscillospiraceae TaxID=216572 RepID=UPI0008379F23|nr:MULTISPECIES: pyruvate formate lyase family protein [Anaerotruncus]